MILINMEMPKKCADCPFFESKYHYHGCLAKPESINNMDMWNFDVGSRPTWCPLIEVPPHGDLIDRDALLDSLNVFSDRINGDEHFLNGIDTAKELAVDAPTIIEAEGEDG